MEIPTTPENADARRYRWMRERHENTIIDLYASVSTPAELDALIDAEAYAMEQRSAIAEGTPSDNFANPQL